MKKDELFFVNLFKKKFSQKNKSVEISEDEKDKSINLEETENEWKQEYELIYKSYSFEIY